MQKQNTQEVLLRINHSYYFSLYLFVQRFVRVTNGTKFLEVLDGDVAREKNIEGSTPLHTLIQNKSPLHFINALLKACPDAIKAKDALGQTPLHCCIKYKAEMEVIQAIYKAWPGGVGARNEENKTPVDYVKTFGAHPKVSNMFASTGTSLFFFFCPLV